MRGVNGRPNGSVTFSMTKVAFRPLLERLGTSTSTDNSGFLTVTYDGADMEA